ncbi:MAG: hypothetical protein GY947_22790 [Rhodobacteraceae bacterium]|nr:hypothetical protein [Paracoccaceae bacterium]
MKRFATILMSLVLVGSQVQALSCRRPNLARSFNWYQESEDGYQLAVGSISEIDPVSAYVTGKPRSTGAVFKGQFFGLAGLGTEKQVPITITTTCLASWCGNFPELDIRSLVFLKASDSGPVLEIPPCPGGIFGHPSPRRIDILLSCLRQGKCSEAQIKILDFQ